MPAEILNMGLRNQPVKIDAPHIVFGQNNGMVGGLLLHQVRAGRPFGIDLRQCGDLLFFQHLDKFYKDPRSALRVVHRPMMVIQ